MCVVRDDLPPGDQLAQTAHAAALHALLRPEQTGIRQTIVCLAAPGDMLLWLSDDPVVWREPDLADTVTAVAFVGRTRATRGLPLAPVGRTTGRTSP